MNYHCKISGDMPCGSRTAQKILTERFKVFGGMSHTNDTELPDGVHAPTAEDSELTFTIYANNGDEALAKLHLMARTISDSYIISILEGMDDYGKRRVPNKETIGSII